MSEICNAVNCPQPPDIRFGTREPGSNYINIGEVVQYKCNENYQFPDKGTTKRVTCYGTGVFGEDIPDCQGMSNFL